MPFLLIIPAALIAIFLASYGAALVARLTANATGGWLGDVLKISLGPAVFLTKPLTRMAEWIAHSMKPGYDAASGKVAGWLSGLGQASAWAAAHSYRNSLALSKFAHWIVHIWVPGQIHASTKTAVKTSVIVTGKTVPLGAKYRYEAARQKAALKAAIAAALPGIIAKDFPRLRWTPAQWRRYIGAVAAAGAIAIPFPRIRDLERARTKQGKTNADVNKRLKKLEKIGAIAGLAALVTATFGAEITRFLRCRNTRGIAKAWCNADLGALTNLLWGLVAAVGTFDLVAYAKFLQPLVEDGAKIAGHFWRTDVAGGGVDQTFGAGGGAALRDPKFGTA